MVNAVTTLATVALATLATAAPVLPRDDCVSGLYMIVARGTNEAAGEGVTEVVADAIAARVPGSTSVAVDYPATAFGSAIYPVSVTDGINDTKQKIQDYVDACGDSSRIVLLGFSQGGNVMTDVLAGGVDKPAPISDEYGQYITGVAVFGDPTFTVGQSFDRGNATQSGIFARSVGGSSLALLNTGLHILIARGSTISTDRSEKASEFGDVVVAKIPNSTWVNVEYPASLFNGDYDDSVAKGHSRLALVGYSQGAQVMTDLLAGPALFDRSYRKPKPLDQAYRKYIKAVVVFADPTFRAHQTFDAGSAQKSGMMARSNTGLAFLKTYSKVLRSYCDARDWFCAHGKKMTSENGAPSGWMFITRR
ncbi:carbohydrate esterase family 5 protein [Acrodontium crateriforme]|uniref:Carbohydrate esterase family 5 protein n=1 Tax=Acrodontium crateriforme TaxID=150365 RepID=A0AAQ3M459_9PEZI|nr:carbohydrate esterase family 5 protein [Acrodontium crateriforme]